MIGDYREPSIARFGFTPLYTSFAEVWDAVEVLREVLDGDVYREARFAVRREQLATQLARAFIQEKAAQEKRIDSEKAKATADQQSKLVESEINVQRSVQNAQAARNDRRAAIEQATKL